MRPIPKCVVAVVIVGCFVAVVVVAGEQECDGPYKGRTLTPEELATVLRNHRAWMEAGGAPDDTRRANLCQANLLGGNLQGVLLPQADLQKALLVGANLQQAVLGGANLLGASLSGANLQGAVLSRANLQRADLIETNLQGAVLSRANLQEANLVWADLQRANLIETNLQGAVLSRANLQEAVYEPHPGTLPNFLTLTDPRNHLEMLVFHTSPAALIALREAFKRGGMRTQERQLTYAIEHTRRLQAWDPSWFDPKRKDTRPWLEKLAGKSESLFSYVLFELPSGYGMVPSRALQTLGLLIVLFSVPYMVAVNTRREAGIWMVWLPDRVHKGEGETSPVRVTPTFFFSTRQERAAGHWWEHIWRWLSTALIGLYFSLLSAFSLGWRELNVGTWIARVQPREYTLRPTGWVRTVSGIQSLLSVYLLALWVLTYFGRPFE